MKIKIPDSDIEVAWLARAYEEIGEDYIADYEISEDSLLAAKSQIGIWLSEKEYKIYIAYPDDSDSEIIGGIISHLRNSPLDNRPECYIDVLYVHDKFRKQGYGAALMKKIDQWRKRNSAERIKLFVSTSNASMIEFCRKIGYFESFVEFEKRD